MRWSPLKYIVAKKPPSKGTAFMPFSAVLQLSRPSLSLSLSDDVGHVPLKFACREGLLTLDRQCICTPVSMSNIPSS